MLGGAQPQKTFGDEALEPHVSNGHFLMKAARLVDWTAFDGCWPRLYGAAGKPSADPLVCFKMLLPEQRYNLCDPECEARCAGRLSFRRFLGLSPADTVPDETVLARFRTRPIKAGIAEELFAAVLAQVEAAGVMIRRGTLMDATIVQSARKAPAGGEERATRGGDGQAGWAAKGGIADGWKARRSLGRCRYVGLKKNALHFTLPAMARNLRRRSVLAA